MMVWFCRPFLAILLLLLFEIDVAGAPKLLRGHVTLDNASKMRSSGEARSDVIAASSSAEHSNECDSDAEDLETLFAEMPQLPQAHLVFTDFGLCAGKDKELDAKWATLIAETAPKSRLNESWHAWMDQLKLSIENATTQLHGSNGISSVHLSISRNGKVTSASIYDGPQRPFKHWAVSRLSSQKLAQRLANVHSSPFPHGSTVTEVHVLVSVWDHQ
jgi:hypothetical protein